MSAEEQTTRTPDPEGADAQAKELETGGTQGEDGRDAGQSDTERLNLEWKANLEAERKRREALEAKLAEIERRQEQPPAARGADPGDREARRKRVERYAEEHDDPVAQDVLDMRRELADLYDGIMLKAQLDEVQDPAEKREVYAHFQANRGRGIDIRAARAEVRERKLAEENDRLAKEREELRAELARFSKKPDPNVIRTVDRGVTASEHKIKEMTMSQWEAEQASLSGPERRAQQRALRNGHITIKG